LGALCFWGYVFVLQLFVYLISEGFSRSKSIAKIFLLYSAYLKTSLKVSEVCYVCLI
jgi:hypothetical protein